MPLKKGLPRSLQPTPVAHQSEWLCSARTRRPLSRSSSRSKNLDPRAQEQMCRDNLALTDPTWRAWRSVPRPWLFWSQSGQSSLRAVPDTRSSASSPACTWPTVSVRVPGAVPAASATCLTQSEPSSEGRTASCSGSWARRIFWHWYSHTCVPRALAQRFYFESSLGVIRRIVQRFRRRAWLLAVENPLFSFSARKIPGADRVLGLMEAHLASLPASNALIAGVGKLAERLARHGAGGNLGRCCCGCTKSIWQPRRNHEKP